MGCTFELFSEADVSARYLPSTLARTWITRHFVAYVFVVALALPHTLRRLLLVCGVLQSLVHTVLQQGAVLASPGLNPFDKQPGTACSGASSVWCYQASVVLSCFFPAEQCGGCWGLLDMCLSPLCKCTAGDCVTRQKAAQT